MELEFEVLEWHRRASCWTYMKATLLHTAVLRLQRSGYGMNKRQTFCPGPASLLLLVTGCHMLYVTYVSKCKRAANKLILSESWTAVLAQLAANLARVLQLLLCFVGFQPYW
jgi:hypothetical protein